MIEPIKLLTQRLSDYFFQPKLRKGGENPFEMVKLLSEELEKLNPEDFLPAKQTDFLQIRREVKQWATSTTGGHLMELCKRIPTVLEILDYYGGLSSGGVARSFVFVSDQTLRSIVERDYHEVAMVLFPAGAWKSTVVMSGGILEAILHDMLTSDQARNARAFASKAAPKDRQGKVKDIFDDKWTLQDMISVATEIGLIPEARSKSIDQVLRDYRNFVHPRKEVRSKHACGKAEAMMAVGALDAILSHFESMKAAGQL